MLARGVFLAPSQFEAMFVSMAHTDAEIEATIDAARALAGSHALGRGVAPVVSLQQQRGILLCDPRPNI